MAKTRGLSKADLQLWAAYGQTLKLLPGKTRLPVEPEPAPPITVTPPATPAAKVKTTALAKPVDTGAPPAGLDKSTWKKFSSGKIRTMQKLDLHGHTAARAHHAVSHFLERAYADNVRVVEIVTGKGEVLLRELPHWLNSPQLRPLILAAAHPHAANTGSVRILLRRMR